MTIIILLSSLTVFWAKFYHKPPFLLFACLPKRILKKILDRGNLLCSAFLASLWTLEEEIKNRLSHDDKKFQTLFLSRSFPFFASLLCTHHKEYRRRRWSRRRGGALLREAAAALKILRNLLLRKVHHRGKTRV